MVKNKNSTLVYDNKSKVSDKFITALAIVSIIGFIAIISDTLFSFDLTHYAEALLMLVIGIGLILEAKIKTLSSITHGFTQNNFTHLVTTIVGGIAIVAGLFSIPQIRLEHQAFLAIKGILSIIAIIIIFIQTWVID
jgi:hypothetical protein